MAVGDAEAFWVERAARQPVRELEELVRRAGGEPAGPDEGWLRLRTHLPSDERLVVDAALDCARRILPGSSRAEQWEAIAQEVLGELAADDGASDERQLRSCFRPIVAHEPRVAPPSPEDREGLLAPMGGCPAPEVRFDDSDPAEEVDRKLRALARLRRETEDLLGHCAHAIRRTGLHRRLGFDSFRHYVEERLQLPPRAVEHHVRKRPSTVSQRVRERDGCLCMVPGCSHVATDSHHVLFRSRGGGDEQENQVALCEFHHLRCIHEGWLAVTGVAPDGLTWRRKGVPFTGMV